MDLKILLTNEYYKKESVCVCVRQQRQILILHWNSLNDGLIFTPANVKNILDFMSPGGCRPGPSAYRHLSWS